MAYVTSAQLQTALGTDLFLRLFDDNADGTADAAVVADTIAKAEARINGYCGGRYSISALAASPPPDLLEIATAICKQIAYLRKPEFSVEGKTPVEGEYRDAIGRLKDVQSGKYRLDVDGTPDTPQNVGGQVVAFNENDTGTESASFFKNGMGDF